MDTYWADELERPKYIQSNFVEQYFGDCVFNLLAMGL